VLFDWLTSRRLGRAASCLIGWSGVSGNTFAEIWSRITSDSKQRSINAMSRRLAGAESTASTLRGLRRCQCEFEAASVDLFCSFRQSRWESGFANLVCQARRSSLDLLVAAYQQRVLWAAAHADSKLPANHSNDGGVFWPSSKSAPPSYENAQHLVALGCFFPSRDPGHVSLHRIDRQENVRAYLGLLVNSLQPTDSHQVLRKTPLGWGKTWLAISISRLTTS